jgi:hypothetical protein
VIDIPDFFSSQNEEGIIYKRLDIDSVTSGYLKDIENKRDL